MRTLGDLMNIGPVTIRHLQEIGITTEKELRLMGPIAAYCQLKKNHPKNVTIMCLYALYGALVDTNLLALPIELKAQLKKEAASFSKKI